MLTGVHLLLSYRCTHACDHCFVFGSPRARGTFTWARLEEALRQAKDVRSVEWAYFEGGEPFLHYALMLRGIERARELGLRTGVVTNAYWAETVEDALLWLEPLRDLEIQDLSISDDAFHEDGGLESPATHAVAAAERLGLPVDTITVTEADALLRGRAATRLAAGRARKSRAAWSFCPEDLAHPSRVHLDAYGNVHVCQGVLLGNAWETPLARIMATYDPYRHPVVGPLVRGGPAALANDRGLEERPEGWASACELCFAVRLRHRAAEPEVLGPAGMYEEPP